MKRKIYNSFSIIVVLAVVLTSALISMVFYNTNKTNHETRLQNVLELMGNLPENPEYYEKAKNAFKNMRITLIDKDGEVLYDSDKWSEEMGDHADREEFVQARKVGRGSAVRYSETMHENYYYYAIKLDSGSVLRISEMQQNIYRTFQKILLPVLLIVCIALIITFLLGNAISNSIVNDLKAQVANLADNESGGPIQYKELYPVKRVIEDQQENLNNKMQNLQDYRQTMEAILSNMREGLIFINDVNRIELINKRALILLDRDPHMDYKDRSVFYLSRDEEFMAAISNNDPFTSKIDIELGESKIRAIITPINGRTEFSGKIIVLRDITEDVILERERREFTSNVAHELRTPLTSINGYAELLSIGKVNENDVKKIGGTIFEEGKRILRLIESMMNLSKLEEMEEIPKEELRVDKIVDNTMELYRLKAKEKNIRLEENLEPIRYNGNKKIIEEIVYNLIDNAYKYGQEGGYIKVSLIHRENYFMLQVEDNGIGISDRDQEKIFQRFYTADPSRHRKDSSGIGLSIVKHGVDKLGGKIYLESVAGKGSTFTVEIPY